MNLLTSHHIELSDEIIERSEVPLTGEIRLWDKRVKGLMSLSGPAAGSPFASAGALAAEPSSTPSESGEAPGRQTMPAQRQKRYWVDSGASERTKQAPSAPAPSPGSLTIDALCDRYLSEGQLMKMEKRSSSWAIDAMNLNRHVRPLIGKLPIAGLKRSDVAQMLKDIIDGKTAGDFRTGLRGLARVRGGRGSAERTLTTFRAMLNWAILQDLLSANPSKGLSVPKAAPRERFLSDREAAELFATLKEGQEDGTINGQHANLIRLLLLTGARKSELMALRWEEVDRLRSPLLLAPERTKSGGHNGARRIPLSGAARAVLDCQNPRESGYVFPSARTQDKHMIGIQKTWNQVRRKAGLGNMRLHDLRHSFASFAIANGENIVVIADVLGHASTRMTERYLHLRDDHLNALSERTGQRILSGQIGGG